MSHADRAPAPAAPVPDRRAAPGALYRAVWRWHFYAGLFVLPFLAILAVTGSIYLFDDEIDDLVHRDLRLVGAGAAPPLPLDALLGAARGAYPGATASRVDTPAAPDRAAVVFMTPPDGADLRVHVDPYTGRVLGAYDYARSLVGVADLMHGSLLLGTVGDRVVELAACWAVVLVITGLYLWWPRGGTGAAGGVFRPRPRARGRRFWRDLHAVTGVYVALGVLFLVLTGLPWAGLWGDLLTRAVNGLGVGYPSALYDAVPTSEAPVKAKLDDMPWTLDGAPVPASTPPAVHAGHHGAAPSGAGAGVSARPIGIDTVAAIARARGVPDGYRLTLPDGPEGVYTVGSYPDRPEGQRTLHVDQYSGRVLADVRFADYGAVAKPVEWGIAIHMGDYFGRANQLLMLAIAAGIVVLAATGAVLWWRRRPRGRLGAPPAPVDLGRARGVAVIAVVLGVVFPLVGASLLVVLALDRLVLRRVPRLRAAFG